jgi:hypothetical protein
MLNNRDCNRNIQGQHPTAMLNKHWPQQLTVMPGWQHCTVNMPFWAHGL